MVDYRVISVRREKPNIYDAGDTFVIPVKIIKFLRDHVMGPIMPIIIERLDFFSGDLKKTLAITFVKSVNNIFDAMGLELPIETECVVFKENNKIKFKVIGYYNVGVLEKLDSVPHNILDNDEQILKVYNNNYREIRDWVGNINSNENDI